jgi:hypothetical protein
MADETAIQLRQAMDQMHASLNDDLHAALASIQCLEAIVASLTAENLELRAHLAQRAVPEPTDGDAE